MGSKLLTLNDAMVRFGGKFLLHSLVSSETCKGYMIFAKEKVTSKKKD